MDTSYFGNIQNVANPLSISGKAPDWYTGNQFKLLAPKLEFFTRYKNGELDANGYTKEYYAKVLGHLNAKEIYDRLITTYGENVTLLCYEKPGEFCHRRLVANWFETELGIVVPEKEI